MGNETKTLIDGFRLKNESYDTIIRRIYDLAVKEQLREFNKPSKNFIPIEEAIKRIKKN